MSDYPEADPFVVRFRVRELVWLAAEKAIPIHEPPSLEWSLLHPGSIRRCFHVDGNAARVWFASMTPTARFSRLCSGLPLPS